MSSAASSSPHSFGVRMLSEIEDFDDADADNADVDTDDDDDEGALTFTPVPSSPAKQRSRRLHGQHIMKTTHDTDTTTSNNNSDGVTASAATIPHTNISNNYIISDADPNHVPPLPLLPLPPPDRLSTMSSLAYSTASSLWDTGHGGSWYFHPTPAPTPATSVNSTNHHNYNATNTTTKNNNTAATSRCDDDDDEGMENGAIRGVGDIVRSNYYYPIPYHPGLLPSFGAPGGGGGAAAAAASGGGGDEGGDAVLPPYWACWMQHQQLHHQYPPPAQYPPQYYYHPQYQQQPPQPQHQLLVQHPSHHYPPHSPYPDLSHLLPPSEDDAFKVYNSRWIMLLYMSLLNLLSDWTCYSIAPIALLTMNAFGDVDAESLVTVFLAANAIATALEPAILGRLGLRRTILFGGFLLTLGSIVKSGGLQSTLLMGGDGLTYSYSSSSSSSNTNDSSSPRSFESWRLYLGFFLVGLSQPLYQCTPALLSASWFPENERTMATGVALNSNQLGIGCAFVFGTMLVSTEEDILPYFGLLSLISTLTFVGCALQFDDAPPTPPSDTARVIRGDLEIKIPKHWPIIGRFGRRNTVKMDNSIVLDDNGGGGGGGGRRNTKNFAVDAVTSSSAAHTGSNARTETSVIDALRDWEAKVQENQADVNDPYSSSTDESVEGVMAAISNWNAKQHRQSLNSVVHAPSPASMDEPVVGGESSQKKQLSVEGIPILTSPLPPTPPHPLMTSPDHPFAPNHYAMMSPPPGIGYYQPYLPPYPGIGNCIPSTPSFYHGYDESGHYHNSLLESALGFDDYRTRSLVGIDTDDEGVEPIMTQVDRQLDIDIRDDQLIQQFKACFRRKGFSHCVVAFTTSGIIINTLSTYMDYLVTLNGAGREYVGIVGGTFQILIMCSSLVFGGWTDASRKYYFVTLAMLIFGAFALAVCNVDLDSNAGGDLRWNLLTVAVLAGPLQPISTELGVEVVYPLSENTVLVIQQLFSNLLSAAFIPIFKALRDVGMTPDASEVESTSQLPQYTFSFYMLIIISTVATCYFATFNGTYLRYEAEEARKAEKESERERLLSELQKQHRYGSAPVQ